MEQTKVETAFDNFDAAEQNSTAIWKPDEPVEDEFQTNIKATAKHLLASIDAKSKDRFVEAADLAKMTKAICDLQNAFYGKEDKMAGNVIMTNQLSMFKGMM